LRRRTSQDMTF